MAVLMPQLTLFVKQGNPLGLLKSQLSFPVPQVPLHSDKNGLSQSLVPEIISSKLGFVSHFLLLHLTQLTLLIPVVVVLMVASVGHAI
jgi:hypothetical protein